MQRVKTSVMIAPSMVNPSMENRSRHDILFSPYLNAVSSHIIKVEKRPYIIKAYNIVDNECINVLQVSERAEAESVIFIKGKKVQITAENTILILDIPGRYKFEMDNPSDGIWLEAQESTMDHWTCGLFDMMK